MTFSTFHDDVFTLLLKSVRRCYADVFFPSSMISRVRRSNTHHQNGKWAEQPAWPIEQGPEEAELGIEENGIAWRRRTSILAGATFESG